MARHGSKLFFGFWGKGCWIVIFVFGLQNCVSSRITSFGDPAFLGKKIYQNVLIHSPDGDLETRDYVESLFKNSLEKRGTAALRAMDIFPPTRSFEKTEISMVLQEKGIDGILQVGMTAASYETSYHASSNTTYNYYGSQTSTTVNKINKPIASYEANLIDVVLDKVAWKASIKAGGSAFNNFKDLTKASALEILHDLRDKGFIKGWEK